MHLRVCITSLICACWLTIGCGKEENHVNERRHAEDRPQESAQSRDLSNGDAASGIDNLDPVRQRQFIVELINANRQQMNLVLMNEDDKLDTFAEEANNDIAAGNAPHNYIKQQNNQSLQAKGICKRGAENQAPHWPFTGFETTIRSIMKAMYDPTNAPSHYENLTNNQFVRLGVSFKQEGMIVNFTVIFSESCP